MPEWLVTPAKASTHTVATGSPSQSANGASARRPLIGGVAGLVLAGGGQFLAQWGDTTWLFVLLYLAGVALFTVSARQSSPAAADLPADARATPGPPRRLELWSWSLLAVGGGVAAAFNYAALSQLGPGRWDTSAPGAVLWGISIVVFVIAGMAVGTRSSWPARWGARVWPSSWGGRGLLLLTVLAVMALATAARLLWLDQVPRGINPDEGDRAFLAMRIVRGTCERGLLDVGWFYIGMPYFYLLAEVMEVAGVNFVGARVFGALSGILMVAVVAWIGMRHFGYRVGVIAGAISAVLGVALQFSRETSEATPTALLWTVSAASFLEAARRGTPAAWILAGLAGGFSMYFYPTGRMWPALAALFCLYLFAHGLGVRRVAIVRGVVLAALASLLAGSPYLLRASENNWEIFLTRARYVSVFVPENLTRLQYYQQEWSTARMLREQVQRSLGIINRYHDRNGFWPTQQPLLSGLLAVLTLMGLGWVCLRPKDPRFVLLAIWFLVGLAGVTVTVETPSLQRMATAVPAFGLFPALVLDSLARQLEAAVPPGRGGGAQVAPSVATGLAALLTAGLMVQQWRFYFVTYAAMDEWSEPTLMGRVVHEQGDDTQVFSLGRQSHIVNQGWVRLLAPNTPVSGLPAPGTDLPVPLPADWNLAFMVMPEQPHYLPYLRTLYPAAIVTPAVDRGQVQFNMYRVSKEQWLATQGALAALPQGDPVRVAHLGAAPPGWGTFPSRMRWTATWRVPQYWNYAVQIGPGPARLSIDGTPLLTVPAGVAVLGTQLSLAQGDHFVDYEGMLESADRAARFEWASIPSPPRGRPAPPLEWQAVPPGMLWATASGPDGLFGVVTSEGRAEQRRLDGTLATGNLSAQVRIGGRPYTATWSGTLKAPVSGTYAMTLFALGAIDLRIDGQPALHTDGPRDEPIAGSVPLEAGMHPVEVRYRVKEGPGTLEWTWTPPGGERSLVPRSVLVPPSGGTVGPPLPFDALGSPDAMPINQPLEIVR